MRAWKGQKLGLENVFLSDNEPLPEIKGDYDVLIKVLAVGLNPVDYKRTTWQSTKFPFTLGEDACGIVIKRGNKVDPNEFIEGKTFVLVLGNLLGEYGYFAEYAVHDSRYLSIVPESLYEGKSIEEVASQIAALPVAAYTAYHTVCNKLKLPLYSQQHRSDVRLVKNVVATGGAGGVGGYCLQFLKLWRETLPEKEREGVKIITTCSAKNFDYVKKLGATHAIDYNQEDVVSRLKELSDNEGIDILIDNIGGDTRKIAIETLAHSGEFAIVADGENLNGNDFIWKGQTLQFIMLGGIYRTQLTDKISIFKRIGDEILELISKGKFDCLVSEVLPFEKLHEGLVKLKEGHVRGKIVAQVQKM